MKYFVFRNQTVEPFLGYDDIEYSGYDDISVVPENAKRYIWFYQVPFNMDRGKLVSEIATYISKLKMVLPRLGNKEIWIFTLENLFRFQLVGNDTKMKDAVNDFNKEIFKLAAANSLVRVIDFSEFTSRYAEEQLVNWKFYFISQTQLNTKLYKDFGQWFSQKEKEIALKRKKCIVLDLDNTLWNGILGEDGVTGIQVGGDYPGNAFLYWQQALLELSKTGVILTVCSKNNEQDVLDAWSLNPFMILKKEHFSAWRINWKDKATNIKELSKELNIGLDSMVFIDDNPTERELVRQMLPMVVVPDFPKNPYDLLSFYRDLVDSYFRIYSITDEDRAKTEQYKANVLRLAERDKFMDMDSYLKSLDIKILVSPANEFNISRIAQMTQKTNQFNLTTHRLTEQDIRQQIIDGWHIFCISVSDRFGDNGITGVIFLTPDCHIDNLLLSCRILGKGIEFAFVSFILNHILNNGVRQVTARYLPSSKNIQTADFYDKLGFILENEDKEGKHYKKELLERITIKDYYKIAMK